MDIKKIAIELAKNRAVSKLTQKELSDKSGVASKTIQDIEKGIANPTIGTLNALAETLKVSPYELLGIPLVNQGSRWKDLSDAASFLSNFSTLSPRVQRVVWAIVFRDPKLVREHPELIRTLE